jgi:hypothetical protein
VSCKVMAHKATHGLITQGIRHIFQTGTSWRFHAGYPILGYSYHLKYPLPHGATISGVPIVSQTAARGPTCGRADSGASVGEIAPPPELRVEV